MGGHILAIDQGTTSTRSIVFDDQHRIVGFGQQEYRQLYPNSGWVEHDPEEIWDSVVDTAEAAINSGRLEARDIAAIGITNQRETVLLWDRETGWPVHHAIVWQDRRTAETCDRLRAEGLEPFIQERTGLLLDPYFSATKIAWVLDHYGGLRARAEAGRLCFGTVDTFLIWRLTRGRVHATDATNAARTLLYDIERNCWDEELLRIFNVPAAILPEVKDSADDFGVTDPNLFGAAIPIRGVAGDQQAATIGNACFMPGMMKSTYGTGCFVVLNTGGERVPSQNRLLTTIAYRLKGRATYALEGSIFVAGAAVKWLRDGLKMIERSEDVGSLAASADPREPIYLVPAFVGLGAPYWDAGARGGLYGMTFETTAAEIARAALEAVAFQTHDLMAAMAKDFPAAAGVGTLRVDGGMTASDWTMQRLADILNRSVERPTIRETTALGAAWLAGSGTGVWPEAEVFAQSRAVDRRFEPNMDAATRAAKLSGWHDAVARTLSVRR